MIDLSEFAITHTIATKNETNCKPIRISYAKYTLVAVVPNEYAIISPPHLMIYGSNICVQLNGPRPLAERRPHHSGVATLLVQQRHQQPIERTTPQRRELCGHSNRETYETIFFCFC